MDEGSNSASELTPATLLKLIRDVLFLSIWRPYFNIERGKMGHGVFRGSISISVIYFRVGRNPYEVCLHSSLKLPGGDTLLDVHPTLLKVINK